VHTDKTLVKQLVDLCAMKGIEEVILSPGSRNAPLTISFDEHEKINCSVIPDERCAGFFALGIAQQSNKPVAICCTSGTASLNYAPAIAEAFYQRIPLLVLTADRPVEWINQGEGQSIVQREVYKNFILGSYELPQDPIATDEVWSGGRVINEAIDLCTRRKGPVHINIPLKENLYGTTNTSSAPKLIKEIIGDEKLSSDQLDSLATLWDAHEKILILCGQSAPNLSLQKALQIIADDPSVAILTETTANLYSMSFNGSIDRVVNTLSEAEKQSFAPTLLITCGGAIISKKIKTYLRTSNIKDHWNITEFKGHYDTFQSLTKSIYCSAEHLFHGLKNRIKPSASNYRTLWKGKDLLTEEKHNAFLNDAKFCDLKAYHIVMDFLPPLSIVHMANSTAVRYVQLFRQIDKLEYFSNRGTSGIDGSTSTAAGMAFRSDKINTLLTGDMSFYYDSNAFWNRQLMGNFKIIMINNQGGGIFRIIEGPDSTNQLEQYFETKQEMTAEGIATQFNLNYHQASNSFELEKELEHFFSIPDNNRPSILEIFTPQLLNDKILKAYFTTLH
jgi:2-succinyl-5-enolpyruvyl-6-hydroxy-3-cyclohexene-1-carboxylate synthase